MKETVLKSIILEDKDRIFWLWPLQVCVCVCVSSCICDLHSYAFSYHRVPKILFSCLGHNYDWKGQVYFKAEIGGVYRIEFKILQEDVVGVHVNFSKIRQEFKQACSWKALSGLSCFIKHRNEVTARDFQELYHKLCIKFMKEIVM